MNELYKKTAIEVVNLLKRKTISPFEGVEHAISRIEDIDKHVNALPIRCFERAIEQAKVLIIFQPIQTSICMDFP